MSSSCCLCADRHGEDNDHIFETSSFARLVRSVVYIVTLLHCYTDHAVCVLFANMAADSFVMAAYAIDSNSNIAVNTRYCLMTGCFLVCFTTLLQLPRLHGVERGSSELESKCRKWSWTSLTLAGICLARKSHSGHAVNIITLTYCTDRTVS
jgi:hypothetical protein